MVEMDSTCAMINKLNDYRLGKTCWRTFQYKRWTSL